MAQNRSETRAGHQPIKWLFGYDREVTEWVRQRLDNSHFGPATAIGLVKDGKIIAGVVYHNYRLNGLEMSIATEDRHWATKQTLRTFFAYPFNQLNCERVTALVSEDNIKSRDMVNRLGFIKEGVLRKAFNGRNIHIYGMLKDECKWIGETNGRFKERQSRRARCA